MTTLWNVCKAKTRTLPDELNVLFVLFCCIFFVYEHHVHNVHPAPSSLFGVHCSLTENAYYCCWACSSIRGCHGILWFILHHFKQPNCCANCLFAWFFSSSCFDLYDFSFFMHLYAGIVYIMAFKII